MHVTIKNIILDSEVKHNLTARQIEGDRDVETLLIKLEIRIKR